MVRVCNENMANAIRILTVEQGTDPRDHALIAFGGAGPTHACEIADALDIRHVLVPPAPGRAPPSVPSPRFPGSTPSAVST